MPARDLLDSLTQTEVRIVAENAKYVVIAVRLERSAIARNIPFLAALCDMTPALVPAAPPGHR